MKEKEFYKMLAEIHEAVSYESCGCMGSSYTPERVEKEDKHTEDFNPPEKIDLNGRTHPRYIPSDRPLDYLGNIIRRYVKVK